MAVTPALSADPSAAALCRHCGEQCDAVAIVTPAGAFCCSGCESVFTLLDAHALTAFYACDVAPGLSQRSVAARDREQFAALDDPAIRTRVVDFDDGAVARVTFSVPSLHCASCVWLLEQLWRFDPGIRGSEADLLRRTIRVTFDPAATSLRRVAEQLATLGYPPALETELAARSVRPEQRRLYLQIGVAGFAFGNIMLFSIPRYANGAPLAPEFQRLFDSLNLALSLPVLVFSAADYFRSAWHAARARAMVLDVPVALGLAVLFARSVVDIVTARGPGFLDSFAGLVFFLLVGRLFQQRVFDRIAFDRTYRSFFPLSVRVERAAGPVMLPLEAVRAGDLVLVRPGEIVPADAVLVDDEAIIDYAFVTGEADPITVRRGAPIRAGGRAAGRACRLQVVRGVAHSHLAALWSSAAFGREKVSRLAGLSARFGAWFTVGAIGLACAGAVAWWPDTGKAAQVATAVLIIACPCALTLAAPITLGTAMGMLGRCGFYLKRASVVLDLAEVDTVAFDKTGTLTTASQAGRAAPDAVSGAAWRLVQRLASESTHPASRAIAAGAPGGGVVDFREYPGLGIRGTVDGHDVTLGSPVFVSGQTGVLLPLDDTRTAVAIDGQLAGWVIVAASPRRGVEDAARRIAASHRLCLLSGDHAAEAERWRSIFKGDMWFRQSPGDKLAIVEAEQAAGHLVLMVGDGLNDAGALAAADVGVAVSDETACVVPACDGVLAGDQLAQLPEFLTYARQARRVLVACFLVSLAYNTIGLTFALTGALTPLATAILMPISSLTIVGLSTGSMRWHARRLVAA